MASDDPRIGTILQGRYRVLDAIAAGGMGVVYRGERVGPAFYASKRANWTKDPAGTEVAVAKADGKAVKLILADYY